MRGIARPHEGARRWAHADLYGYPTLSAEEETEATLATAPKAEHRKKRKRDQE
jgi:hypothetical protein